MGRGLPFLESLSLLLITNIHFGHNGGSAPCSAFNRYIILVMAPVTSIDLGLPNVTYAISWQVWNYLLLFCVLATTRYGLTTVNISYDFIVPPHWETMPPAPTAISHTVTLSRQCANQSLSYPSDEHQPTINCIRHWFDSAGI